MKKSYPLIGGIIGIVGGILAYYLLPYLMLFGVFGNWLNAGDYSPVRLAGWMIDNPFITAVFFIAIGVGIGLFAEKRRKVK